MADCRPILQVEMENSMNLRLLSHEQIENYNSKISNKGSRIYKTVQSPEHFAEVYWGTTAWNPEDIQAALTTSM